MRRIFALLIVGALVLGVVYYWKYQPGRLPHFRTDKLGSVGTKLGEVGESVSEKFRATRTKGAVKAALELQGHLGNRVVRSPLVEATDLQVLELERDLVDSGLLEDSP